MEFRSPISNDSNDNFSIEQYYRILKKRKLSIAIILAITLSIAIIYIKKAQPVFQASAKIQADPIQPNATSQDQFVMNSMVFLFYETQYEIITSRQVAETVVEKLNLATKLDVSSYKNEPSFFDVFKNNIVAFLSNDEIRNKTRKDHDEKRSIADNIRAGLNVSGGTQSQIINISYMNEDPVLAAEIVNATAEAYIEFGLESRLKQYKDTASWLTDQLEDLRLALQNSEDKLRNFRTSQNLMDTEQQQRIANTQLQTLNTELVRAQTQLSEIKALYDQVTRIKLEDGNIRSLGPVLQSATIRDLVREETLLNRKVEELSDRYGEKHPKLVSAKAELLSVQNNLKSEAAKIIENIEKQYETAQSQQKNIKTLIADTKDNLQSYQGSNFELTRLEREVENNRRIYENFLNRLMEADLSGDYDASNIRIIDKATVPDYPVKPKPFLILAASLIIGFILSLIYVVLREMTGNNFKTPDELEKELEYPVLGITPLVPRGKGISPELQYIEDSKSLFSESINTIRTGILFSSIDSPPKSIVVTSTSSSEGKTTLSINLAVALSKMENVLLIEVDLRKPAIAKDLNLAPGPGLCEKLVNDSIEVIQKVNGIPNLSVITCGEIPKNPSELLASDRFRNLLEKYKNSFDRIILDSPPTLPVTDSTVLSKIADVTVLAVKSESTKKPLVKETIKRLVKVDANICGLVLTHASAKKMGYYGDQYYQEEYYGLKQ